MVIQLARHAVHLRSNAPCSARAEGSQHCSTVCARGRREGGEGGAIAHLEPVANTFSHLELHQKKHHNMLL